MVKKNKKIISFILCFALAVSLLSGALTSSANENIVYEECTYVNQFRKNESGHIDEASYAYPAKDGYVFAGWYKKDGNAYIPLSQDEADETAGGYAKYVKKEVLGIKYQFERNRTTGSETIDLRMLTSVDCLDYKSVGFIYSIGGVRKEVQSDTVYERVLGYADSEGKVYEPSVFSTVSKYFMSYTVNDIAKSEYGKQVELIPKWVTNDGTVVIGKGTVFTLKEEIADFYEGLGFENEMDQQAFTGIGDSERNASASKVSYSDANIGTPTGGGEYALKLSHTSNLWPVFQIHFGEQLEQGKEITFWAYAKINGTYTESQSWFEYTNTECTGQGQAGERFNLNQWTQITIPLTEASDSLYLWCNFDAGVSEFSSVEVYIDNVRIGTDESVATGQPDIYDGFDFEIEAQKDSITEQDGSTDATLGRVAYSSAGITSPTGGGDYAMQLSAVGNNKYPHFRINFGRTLPVGTVISFQAYGHITGNFVADQSTIEGSSYVAKLSSNNTNLGEEADQWGHFTHGAWKNLTLTLTAEVSYLDLFWNFHRANYDGNGSETAESTGTLYIDNMRVQGSSDGDLYVGLGFEGIAEADFFTGQGAWNDAAIERIAYENASIDALTDSGSYALRLSHTTNYYPTFKINFGKELPAGTKIIFQAYGKINGESPYNQSIFEYSASSGGGEATVQFKHDGWKELTMTLNNDATYIDLYWNYQRAFDGEPDPCPGGEVYIDNFRVIQPITEGVDFEEEIDAYYITGTTPENSGWRDAFIERVPYATSEMALLEDGGNYALKLRSNTNMYPTFRINFGKELPAGTQITFSAYAKIYEMNLYNHIMFKYLPDEQATKLFKCGSWETLTITLPSDCNYIDMFWDFGQAQGASLADGDVGEVYIDNIVVSAQ